jgi:hypothetical protein
MNASSAFSSPASLRPVPALALVLALAVLVLALAAVLVAAVRMFRGLVVSAMRTIVLMRQP